MISEPGKATRFVWFLGISLMLLFACVLLMPALFRFFHPDAAELIFDEQLKAQLAVVTVGLVWWAIGSSQGSQRKDELAARQSERTMAALAPPGTVIPGTLNDIGGPDHVPTGRAGDPVSTTIESVQTGAMDKKKDKP